MLTDLIYAVFSIFIVLYTVFAGYYKKLSAA